ncbi:MAG: aldehyde:ferredoxin oxidoreductase [Anaerolineae bacterium]|nr:aldehyde:ferredoxin oxidoreductase [Anaerolineae bacterium]
MLANDPLCRVLYVDLNRRRFSVKERPELFEKALGGSGVAIELLHEECPEGTDPLGPENPIILAVGPMVGHYPMASKTVAMFKSPHTGNLGESHAGGRSANAIRMAGYGAIVITGKSSMPIYLVIDNDHVYFRDAAALWGMHSGYVESSAYSVGSVLRRRESGSGLRSIMRIGIGGERQVSYASVITETYRHFGRLGLGAVFGSKLLKALVVTGKNSLPVADRKAHRNTYDAIFQTATQSPKMKKYHELGTAMGIQSMNNIFALPTRNLKSGRFEKIESISGERMAEDFLGRRVACTHCPVACVHLAALRIPYPNDPYFYKTMMVGYDYELAYSNGSMLGISDAEGMLQLLDEIETLGLDAMSSGVALAWATEAFENNLITSEDTDGLELSFGDAYTYIHALRKIVVQPTDFYKALARGVDYASSVYGGENFALAFGGNEMPGYHTGPGAYLGYITGSRHSHLDSGGYSLDQKAVKQGINMLPQAIADQLLKEESWRQVLTSLVVCLFARGVYDIETIINALSAIGIEYSAEEIHQIGKTILKRKHEFKAREGFAFEKIRMPRRIFTIPTHTGAFDEDFLREAITYYAENL